jgi:hypothetical protein
MSAAMKINVVQAVKEGRAQVELADVVSRGEDGTALRIRVFRDALKIDGVRVSATAPELQQVADLLFCTLLTPKVVDLVWEQATVKFEPVIRADGKIVAVSTDQRVSRLVDAEIAKKGGGGGGALIDSIGKYWVLSNKLARPGLLHGVETACNYGWLGERAPNGTVTPGHKCWQPPQCGHNYGHKDPSQVIRLMEREAFLTRPNEPETSVDILDILQDPGFAPLVNHDGVLKYLRMANVPEIKPSARPVVSSYS